MLFEIYKTMSKCLTIVDDVVAVREVIPMSRFRDLSSQARQKLCMQSYCPWDMHISNVFYLPMKFQVNRPYGVMLQTKMALDRQTNQPTDEHSDFYILPQNFVFWGYN